VANAATFQPGTLSPGMLVTIVGTKLGPAPGVAGEIVGGRFTASVAGVWVYFDGIAAPILYAGSMQINAIVPYALAGRPTVQVAVQYGNATSTPFPVRLSATSPGIFTVDGRRAAALNEDGSVNSPANAARAGSVLVLYLTGEGLTIPAGADGEIVAATGLKKPLGLVSVRLNGVEVPASAILYAGSAPSLVAGLMQLNVRLPANTPANAATPVEVAIGGLESPVGVTVAVR
jgi:uncharacterized protein (TIGR03437 family)